MTNSNNFGAIENHLSGFCLQVLNVILQLAIAITSSHDEILPIATDIISYDNSSSPWI